MNNQSESQIEAYCCMPNPSSGMGLNVSLYSMHHSNSGLSIQSEKSIQSIQAHQKDTP